MNGWRFDRIFLLFPPGGRAWPAMDRIRLAPLRFWLFLLRIQPAGAEIEKYVKSCPIHEGILN
jgi:hypothetical protein